MSNRRLTGAGIEYMMVGMVILNDDDDDGVN